MPLFQLLVIITWDLNIQSFEFPVTLDVQSLPTLHLSFGKALIFNQSVALIEAIKTEIDYSLITKNRGKTIL